MDWTSGVEGAGGGALAGASIGGPWGAAIGGGIGLLGGLFGDNGQDQTKQLLNDYYAAVQSRQDPQLGNAKQSSYSDFRGNQRQLVSQLEALSQGKGPSLAAQQFQQATDRNMASQQAVANSGRGGPMAQLTAANNMAGLGAQAAQGSAIARTGEELGALGQLGGVIAQGRAGDEATNMFNVGQQNQFSMANLEAQLRSRGLNDDAIRAIIQGRMGVGNKPTMGDQILAGGAGMFTRGLGSGGGGGQGSGMGLGGLVQGSGLGGAAAGIGGDGWNWGGAQGSNYSNALGGGWTQDHG